MPTAPSGDDRPPNGHARTPQRPDRTPDLTLTVPSDASSAESLEHLKLSGPAVSPTGLPRPTRPPSRPYGWRRIWRRLWRKWAG